MAHIIWNAAGYHIGLSANDTDKDYFLSHEPTATTTSISEADFLSLVRKEKQLIAADHSKDNTDETRYECTKDNHEITDWDCGGRIPNANYFKEILQGIITQGENHLAFHNEDKDSAFNAKVQSHVDNCKTVLSEIDGGSWTEPSWPTDSVYKYVEGRFGSALSDWEIPV